MKNKLAFVALILCSFSSVLSAVPNAKALKATVEDDFKRHTYYLASDELEGRGNGSEGIALAAKYIEAQFRAIGLTPIDGYSYLQLFPIPNQQKSEANVVGVIKAATQTNRSIVFTAHYDALGIIKKAGQKDVIHNGARDNAIGVAAMIEMARQYQQGAKPAHNLVFIATAAEETGQYGSDYYAQNPVFPLKDIIINVNFDGFNVTGPKEDYYVMPRQGVDFVDEIDAVSAKLGWVNITPNWIDQMNNKFDTSTFLRKGVPAFTLWTGDRAKGGKQAKSLKFGNIHSPDDQVSDQWNWDGVEDHINLYKAISDYFLHHPDGIKVTDRKLFI